MVHSTESFKMQNNELVLVGERHLKCQITFMSWSSKRDLLCLATESGELLLHRLTSLEKVWSHQPVDKSSKINSICWRPDGKVIGVSYDTKEVGIQFIYMEKSQLLYTLNNETVLLNQPGILLRWFELEEENIDISLHKFTSLSFKDYISEFPKLQSKDLTSIDIGNIVGNSKFHVLLVCDNNNTITAFAYALFPLFSIPCGFYGPSNCEIHIADMCMSSDFQSMINVSIKKDKKSVCDAQIIDLSFVMRNLDKSKMIAERVCHLKTTINYLENVLDLMKESCETVVQEMETKLTKYLINKSLSGTIGDEFMHFLLWGKPSEVIGDLLLNSMSPKSVIKLGTLVEASYTAIQQLLLVNFQLASDALYYHLVDIKGMSSSTILDDFTLLNCSKIEEVLGLAGSFILKATEMQQVIEQNLKNFKAFFRWLHSSLLKIHDQQSKDPPLMTMKEMEFVADFIMESFIHEHEQLKMSGKEKHFNLDKVYQYLQNSPLATPQSTDSNDWFRLVEATPSLASNPFILKRRPEASLRQLFSELQDQIKSLLFCSSNLVSSDDVTCIPFCPLAVPQSSPLVSTWFQNGSNDDSSFYSLMSRDELPCREISLIRVSSRNKQSTRFKISFSSEKSDELCLIQHFTYFNKEYLTAVLVDQSAHSIVMVSLSAIVEELRKNGESSNSYDLTTSQTCDANQFVSVRCSTEQIKEVACSGSRNILSAIDKNYRLITAYELEQCNDEDMDDTELDSSAMST